ncbi:pyrimidine dimer DNA glycosylase/endonuclease V [soil metagenome]
MRLWSIHPSYLDSKGLVALWREGLLAYHVLSGKTKGYTKHPQLDRFYAHENTIAAIVYYLHAVADEAYSRGFSFNRSKLPERIETAKIPVTKGQIMYEMTHLKSKLQIRDSKKYKEIETISIMETHPLFMVIEGDIEPWEKITIFSHQEQ